MAIEDLFVESTKKVIADRIARPLAEPIPQRSFGANLWGVASSAPKGVFAGAAESAGFFSDILGAYGEVQAGYAAQLDPSLMLDPNKAQRVREEGQGSRARVATGEAFSTEAGSIFRNVPAYYMPDQQSAGTAENLLFGAGRFMTKAVGYTALGGPAVGAALTGTDEAMAEAERLKAQGVDPITRTKVGAVAGVTSGLAVALPVAGNTIKSTAALVLAGGPGGFIAQQAASKAILENAGYDKIGNQYDPFDPVGLAVSTLVPAAFGVHGLRANRATPAAAGDAPIIDLSRMSGNQLRALPHADPRLDAYTVTAAQREGIPPEALLAIKNAGERSESGATSPKGAKGVMQFMDDTWSAYGKGDPRNPVDSIDAGARYLKDLIKQYDGDVRAAIAHYNGGGKAGEAVRAGKAPPAKETQAYLQRTDHYMAEKSGELAGRAVADDPELVAAARVQQVRETVDSWNLGDPADAAAAQRHLEGVLKAGDQIAAGGRVDIGETVPLDSIAETRVLDNMAGRLEQARADLAPEAAGQLAPEAVAQIRAEIARLEETRPPATAESLRALADEIQARDGIQRNAAMLAAKKEIQAQLGAVNEQIAGLRAQVEGHRVASEAQQQIGMIDQQLSSIRRVRSGEAPAAPRKATLEEARTQHAKQDQLVQEAVTKAEARKAGKAQSGAAPEPAGSTTGAQADAAAVNPVTGSIDAQSAEIARLAPDMLVQLDGMDKPMRLADALEAVKMEAAREVQDAPLLQVAAECFLRSA